MEAGIHTSKTNWRLCASYLLYVRDVSRRWNAVITLHQKRSNTMPKVHMQTKIEQCSNCRTFPKELCQSFSSVTGLRAYDELDMSHDRAYGPWGGMGPVENGAGNPVEGIWWRLTQSILFFPTSQGPLVKTATLRFHMWQELNYSTFSTFKLWLKRQSWFIPFPTCVIH